MLGGGQEKSSGGVSLDEIPLFSHFTSKPSKGIQRANLHLHHPPITPPPPAHLPLSQLSPPSTQRTLVIHSPSTVAPEDLQLDSSTHHGHVWGGGGHVMTTLVLRCLQEAKVSVSIGMYIKPLLPTSNRLFFHRLLS